VCCVEQIRYQLDRCFMVFICCQVNLKLAYALFIPGHHLLFFEKLLIQEGHRLPHQWRILGKNECSSVLFVAALYSLTHTCVHVCFYVEVVQFSCKCYGSFLSVAEHTEREGGLCVFLAVLSALFPQCGCVPLHQ